MTKTLGRNCSRHGITGLNKGGLYTVYDDVYSQFEEEKRNLQMIS